MYILFGVFAGVLLVGLLVRRATAPKPQSIGLNGPMTPSEAAPELN